MKLRKMIVVPVVAGLLLGLTGCSLYPDGTINSMKNETVQATENEESHITGKLNSTISIDADVIKPETTELNTYNATNRVFTKEQADKNAELFTEGKEPVEIVENPRRYIYKYSDGSYFYDGCDSISYLTEKYNKEYYEIYYDKLKADKTLAGASELEGLPLNTVIEQMRDLCNKLQLNISSKEPEVYVMDLETMNNITEKDEHYKYYYDKGGKQIGEVALSKEDEVYYIIFEMELDGVPITKKGFTNSSKYANGTKIKVIVGRDGILKFDASYLYDITGSNKIEAELCSQEEAVNILASAYQYQGGLVEKTVKELKLVYAPLSDSNSIGEYEVKPYWEVSVECITTSEKDGVKYENKKTEKVLIDAVTKNIFIGNAE